MGQCFPLPDDPAVRENMRVRFLILSPCLPSCYGWAAHLVWGALHCRFAWSGAFGLCEIRYRFVLVVDRRQVRIVTKSVATATVVQGGWCQNLSIRQRGVV